MCTVCGVVTSRAGSRCTAHARQSNRSRHNALYSTRAWQRLSTRVLRAWRGERGNWCPAYQRPAHPAVDLTVDHGMAVGAEVFDTVWWAGQFAEAVHRVPVVMLPRRALKLALSGDSRAKDANIRAALIDRFGGSAAVGRKAEPGPLYGISRDVWSALAIAVTYTLQSAS